MHLPLLRRCLAGLGFALFSFAAQAQTTGSVGIGTSTPSASALLELSTTNKGLLLPRLTLVQRGAIQSPAAGLLIYQTDNTPGLYIYGGSSWSLLPNATQTPGDNLGNHTATQNLNLGTNQLVGNGGSSGLSIDASGSVGIGRTNPTTTLDVNGTATATNFAYSTAKTATLTLGPEDFQTGVSGSYDIRFYTILSGGTLYNIGAYPGGTSGTAGYLMAPVHLPQGATLTQLSFVALDNDGVAVAPEVQLVQLAQMAGYQSLNVAGGPIATATLTTENAAYQAGSVAFAANTTVDAQTYRYYLVYKGNQNNVNCRLTQVKITYTTKTL